MNDEPKILAGRYEVGDLIGRGGMAEVHIGYDTRLGRTVAIKILRADLARDPSFQTRFRREAQAAAGLNHPTIVAVYDTGEDSVLSEGSNPQAVPFIVMEYVEGHTVRDILKGDVAAPIDEAIEIVTGVLTALDYSHHAGLVHRDIKPANVMLTPTGAVKVMDFGIARALADAGQTMTQTQAVVGTAQYLSPEQARGENVDARSDLYSTGCLLFELLTGRPPFIGDSPVSVAYQHVREAAPLPSAFASDVPTSLDQVVARSLAKSRDDRYSTAQEFLDDLRAVAAGEDISAATGGFNLGSAAAGAGAAGVAAANAGQGHASGMTPEEIEEQPTQVMNALDATDADGTAIMPQSMAPDGAGAPWAATGATGQVAPNSQGVALHDDDELIHDEDEAKRKKRQWLILGGSALAAIILIIALIALAGGNGEPEPELVEVPNLTLATEAEATAQLEELGLVPDFIPETSTEIPAERVIRTNPEGGTEVEVGETVTVFISTGEDVTMVPSVRGLDQATAITRIEERGLVVSEFETDNDPAFEEGRATRTDPEENTELPVGSEVILYISSGQVELPNLVGDSQSGAQSTLAELGLIANIVEVETDDERPGTVLSQSPREGLVPRGTQVDIEVAREVQQRQVPNVVGQSESNARSNLEGDGFSVSVERERSESVPAGNVISQSPGAGDRVNPGTTVTITVSDGPPDPPPPPPSPEPPPPDDD